MKKRNSVYLSLLLISMVLMALPYCAPKSQVAEEKEVFLNLSDTATYVGMNTCRGCHNDIYLTYIETGMGQSFDLASRGKSASKLGPDSRLYDSHLDLHYYPFWNGDSLFLREFRLEGRDTTHNLLQQVHYIIGSGQHTNSHLYSSNGYVCQMPFTYYTQDGKLDLPPGFENGGNTRFSRKIGLECMSCHNAYPQFVEGSTNKFNAVPQGIDCERCHGPGSIHVAAKQRGEIVDTSRYTDYTIVNPANLSPDLAMELCQRCHLQGNAVLKPGKSFYDFRPGMRLSEVMTIFLPRYSDSDDDFIMASHIDRFKQSKCYLGNEQSFNCISCHNPHVSVQKTDPQHFNKSCQSCHSTGKNFCTATEAERAAKENNCVACHMPQSGSIDIPHVTVHDHKIKIPGKEKKSETEAARVFRGLQAINETQPDARTMALAYLQQYEAFTPDPQLLDSAFVFVKKANDIALWVHYYYAREAFADLVKKVESYGQQNLLAELKSTSWSNEHAWTAYRCGQAFYKMGRSKEAEAFFQKATVLAPFELDFQLKYAVCLNRNGKAGEAKKVYAFILTENEQMPEVWSNYGFLKTQEGDYATAEQYFQKALQLNPDYVQAMINYAGLCAATNRLETAEKLLIRALKVEPDNSTVQGALAQVRNMK